MKHFLFVFACGFILACNHNATNPPDESDTFKQDGTELEDSLPIQPDTLQNTSFHIPLPQGIYQGVRYADAATLQHTIAFYPNHTFRLEERKAGKVDVKRSGRWTASDTIIQLQNGAANLSYQWKDGTLMLVQNGQQTVLKKLLSASENKVWAAKKEEGSAFFGVGNEPFWNVTINEQKGIFFHLAEWSGPMHFAPVKARITPDSVVYTAANNSAQLQVIIYPTFCSDGMSDYTYDQKVKVLFDQQVFNGCGLAYK